MWCRCVVAAGDIAQKSSKVHSPRAAPTGVMCPFAAHKAAHFNQFHLIYPEGRMTPTTTTTTRHRSTLNLASPQFRFYWVEKTLVAKGGLFIARTKCQKRKRHEST